MDTFGRLPTEVIEHIKFFYEDPVLEIKIIEDFGWHNLDNIYHINLIITINTNIIYNIQLCVGDCYNKNHILESLKLLILALTNNENTEILFNAKFMITYNYIIIKKDIFELSIKNTHSFRTSLICVLNECYEYVTDF
jgi:hypothetical protein